LTAANFNTTNLTTTNISSGTITVNGITSGTLLVTTSISTGQLAVTNISAGNARYVNVIATSSSVSSLIATSATIPSLLTTNKVATNISSGTLNLSTGITSASAQLTNANVTNLTAANFNLINLTATNLSAGTLNLSIGITSASAQLTNANVTTATIPTLLTTNLTATNLSAGTLNTGRQTTGNILVTGISEGNTIEINAQGSATAPGQIVFTNTAGTGDFRIRGDGGDIQWQGGGGRVLQMGAFHGIQLIGGRNTTTDIPFEAGENAVYNTRIHNTNNSIALVVRGDTGQTENLQQWQNGSGTILARVTTEGSVLVGGNMLYGRDAFLVASTAGSTNATLTYLAKITATTGSLSAGQYIVLTTYQAGAGGGNTTRYLETRTWIDNTNGSLVGTGATPLINSGQSIPTTQFAETTLTAGIHTILLQYRTTNTGTSATIYGARVWLWRIS
jgi:hypothetical protein